MKRKRYPQYKDSGVDWLGEVPKSWKVQRSRFAIMVNPSSPMLRALGKDDEVSFVPMDAVCEYGGLRLDQARIRGEISGGYTEFQDGDIVVAKITPCFENGKGSLAEGLVSQVAYGTTELHVLRVLLHLNNRFLFYLTITHGFRKLGESEMYGAGGQKRIPPEFCKNFLILVPRISEQTTIANFLDHETSQLDTLIAKKQALIELLKEKRTALISQTVTRGLPADVVREFGLEPHTRFKDSGIEWIEEIPTEWDYWKLNHICSKICDGTHFSPKSESSGDYMYVTAKNIKEHGIDNTNITFVTVEDHKSIYSRCPVKKGDVLYIKDGATAGIATVNNLDEEFSMLSSVALIRPKTSILEPRYLSY